jgi:hypothetical protein
MTRAVFSLCFVVVVAACPIPEGDPRSGIGVPCVLDLPACDRDFVCVANSPASDDGLCAPVVSYGTAAGPCEAPRYPLGVQGVERDGTDPYEIADLSDLDALEGVRRVQSDLVSRNPDAATVVVGDVCELSALQRVDGSLGFSELDVETLAGLESLSSIGGILVLTQMPNLRDLTALHNVAVLDGREDVLDLDRAELSLVIANNADLRAEEAAVLVDTIVQNTGDATIRGRTLVCGNFDDDACPAGLALFLASLVNPNG